MTDNCQQDQRPVVSRRVWVLLSVVAAAIVVVVWNNNNNNYGNIGVRFLGQGRIVGGRATSKGAYPWIVSLRNGDLEWSWPTCGGTLITPRVVLTAAHCVGNFAIVDVNRFDMDDDTGVKRYEIPDSDIYPHPLYDSPRLDNDFALVLLPQAQDNVPTLRLNENDDFPDTRSTLTVIGWGRLEENLQGGSKTQQEAQVGYVEPSLCEQRGYRGILQPEMLCAYSEGMDACQGDSGGPLITMDFNTGNDILVGVVSFGRGCATHYPGIYARVSQAVDWIYQTVCGDGTTAGLSEGDCEGGKIKSSFSTSSSSSGGRSSAGSSGTTTSSSTSGSTTSGSTSTSTRTDGGTSNTDTCKDHATFTSVGKKKTPRTCSWVAISEKTRCRWYKEFCPETCKLERCQGASN